MKLKVIKVRLPYKLDGKKSKTSIMIYVEFSDVERCLYWSLRLTGDGIDSLNYWINYESYDNNIYKFLSYKQMIDFLTELKVDIELAWANYNEEKKNVGAVFREIKKLFHSVEKKNKPKRR